MIDARYRCICGHGESAHLTRKGRKPTHCHAHGKGCDSQCPGFTPDPKGVVWVDRTGDIEDKYIPEPNTGCWLWIGAEDDKGYGRVGIPGTRRQTLAHRVLYEKHVGPIPRGMFLCHKCDMPLCVNPQHMFIGTVRENAQDMSKKGRAPHSKNTTRKMTPDLVRELRAQHAEGANNHELARRFPVSRTTVRLIVRGEIWKDVA